jgi:hypothetical protein
MAAPARTSGAGAAAAAGAPLAGDAAKADVLARMDLLSINRAYLQSLVDESPGYKALLLDEETMRFCSTLFGRSELAEHNVVHIERIDSNDSKKHGELKASYCPCAHMWCHMPDASWYTC